MSDFKVFINFSSKYKAVKYKEKYYVVPKRHNIDSEYFKKIYESNNSFSKEKRFSLVINDYNLLIITFLITIVLWVVDNIYFTYILSSLIIHEFSHMLTAVLIGVDKIFLGFRIKLYVFPILYISSNNIYEKIKYQRLLYYLSGIIFHLFLILFLVVFNLDLKILFKINIALLFYNAVPFLFTDGYNVLKELIEIYNLRKIILSNFFRPIVLYKYGNNKKIFCYYIFIIICFLFIFVKLMKTII